MVIALDAADVLADEDDALAVFGRSIEYARNAYAAPIDSNEASDRPVVPFYVVLQSLPADAAAFRMRRQDAGATAVEFAG